MADRLETWLSIRIGLQAIEDAADLIEGVDLDEEDLQTQLEEIKRAVKAVRIAAHDFIQPDKATDV